MNLKNRFRGLRYDLKLALNRYPVLYNSTLQAIDIQLGSIVIDCGANIGNVSDFFLNKGAIVHAFEPNSDLHCVLEKRFNGNDRFFLNKKGVWHEDDHLKFYFHKSRKYGAKLWSEGSSLIREKPNVSESDYETIEVIRLSDYLSQFSEITLIKIDIEGAEFTVLKDLITTGMIHKAKHVLVESHDKKIPSIRQQKTEVEALLIRHKIVHVNLNWV